MVPTPAPDGPLGRNGETSSTIPTKKEKQYQQIDRKKDREKEKVREKETKYKKESKKERKKE